MKYILNYTKVINQLFVLSVLKIWKINSCLWSPRVIRGSQSLTLSTEPQARKVGLADWGLYIKHCIVNLHHNVYHTTLWAADAASKNIASGSAIVSSTLYRYGALDDERTSTKTCSDEDGQPEPTAPIVSATDVHIMPLSSRTRLDYWRTCCRGCGKCPRPA